MSKKKLNRIEEVGDREISEELSIVPRGAQKQSFLMTKESLMDFDELVKEILEADFEKEDELNALLEKQELNDKQKNAIRGAMRLLGGVKDAPGVAKILGAMMEMVGIAKQEPSETEEEKKKKKAAAAEKEAAAKKAAAAKKGAHLKPGEYPAPTRKEDGSLDLSAIPEDQRPLVEMLFKSQEAKDAEIEKLTKSHEELNKSHTELLSSMKDKEFIAKANEDYSHLAGTNPEELGPILKALEEKDPEAAKKIMEVLKAQDAALEASSLLDTHSNPAAHASDAYDMAVSKARTLMEKSDGELTFEAAFDKVIQTEPDLYTRYQKESEAN